MIQRQEVVLAAPPPAATPGAPAAPAAAAPPAEPGGAPSGSGDGPPPTSAEGLGASEPGDLDGSALGLDTPPGPADRAAGEFPEASPGSPVPALGEPAWPASALHSAPAPARGSTDDAVHLGRASLEIPGSLPAEGLEAEEGSAAEATGPAPAAIDGDARSGEVRSEERPRETDPRERSAARGDALDDPSRVGETTDDDGSAAADEKVVSEKAADDDGAQDDGAQDDGAHDDAPRPRRPRPAPPEAPERRPGPEPFRSPRAAEAGRAARRESRRRGDSGAPPVTVRIGRIEVLPAEGPERPAPAPSRPAPRTSLGDYLRRRRGGGGGR